MIQNLCRFVLAALVFGLGILPLPAKSIKLRSQILTPAASKTASQYKIAPAPVATNGLFLIQFTGPVETEWRQQLKALGVDLIRYVPDDTFIARFQQAVPDQVNALPFVTWVGAYRPEYKIHPQATVAARTALLANAPVKVSILLSPLATPKEIAQVRALLVSVSHQSRLRQGSVVRGTLAPARLTELAQSGAVLWIESTPRRILLDETASKIVGGDDGATGTPTLTQQAGFDGTGVTVSVADTGLDTGDMNTMSPDLSGRVDALLYYGSLTNAADEHSHGTHVAGIVAGNAALGEADASGARYGLGVAPGAHLVAQRIFDGDGNAADPFPSDETITHDAVRAGAKIGSNSWGTDTQGAYDIDCAAFDELVRDADAATAVAEPYILEFSAGNAGPASQTMDSPAAAKNVLATGASENGGQLAFGIYDDGPDTMADFSSRGPCEDGRTKPDVVAPGTFIASLLSAAASDQFAWMPISDNYIYMGGTSQAGPHASGAAAVFVQYYQSRHTNAVPSPALVKAALINSAVELDQANGGPGPIPNNDEGWGRISLPNLIVTDPTNAPRIGEFIDQTTPLTNAQIFEHHVFVRSAVEPLKITMAYTDEPGFPGAIPALVNDLDLEVVAPDGKIYRGNQFIGGESIPNAATADNLNNVEGVHLAQPVPGDYTVRVRARNVVQDARVDTAAVDQDFALVISGDLSRTGIGAVLFDRGHYTAPGTIGVTVFDAGRAASNSVSVGVTNLTELNGQRITLPAVTGVTGLFTGAVNTVVGGGPVAGSLAIHNGAAIEARYVDVHGVTRTATATARLLPPVLSNLVAAVDLGLMTVTWQTDEPANSVIRYSTNLTFNLAVTNGDLTTDHLLRLPNLVAGLTYHFFVSSTDEAGNTASNNNGGSYYSFVAVKTPTVLLVDAYEPADGSPLIDDGVYTNALTASGYSFAFWKVTARGGTPQLADLKPFQVVIWRFTDDAINYTGTNNTLSPAQQFAIQSYVASGGSFFASAMEILSRLGDVPFRKNVLQVGKFVVNSDPFGLPGANFDEDFGVPAITGLAASPITRGLDAPLDYTNYPSFDLGPDFPGYGPDFSDTFTPTTNATAIVFEKTSGRVCGVSYPRAGLDTAGRVVFLSFPIDALLAGGSGPNNETNLLRNILDFLVPGVNGVGAVTLDSSAYTLPDLIGVELGDTDLIGAGHTQVAFASSSATNIVNITLNETAHAGLFHGFIALVATNPPATNQLRAVNGDTITARYFDVSAGSNVTATAVVDTVPPVITNIAAAPKYFEATVSWKTSKPTDALVQFGESQLLGRTAYVSESATNHAVTLAGLVANRNYYFQVVSRDVAGNTTVDDNQENLYTLHTLAAASTPWTDSLESGATNWTVISGGGAQVDWQLGVPHNDRATNAHSPPNAWGSNLTGKAIDYADSYLFSPPIDLTLASAATLNFWQNFDFTSPDLIELGELMIATNFNTEAAVSIYTYTNTATTNWQPATISLTPYVGKTIMVVWHYAEFTIGGTPPAGWLVDDVSITASNLQTGVLRITNNLWQSHFTLTGPTNFTGQGVSAIYTNAPAGPYVLTFANVPFYQTPPTQTNMLTAGATLVATGNYRYPDINSNNIPDAWEQTFFGNVSTNRTRFTDTDGDGMSDYAEFIAGTDPNSPPPAFRVTASLLTNGTVRLDWPTAATHSYRVDGSTNGKAWTPFSGWIYASGPATNHTIAPMFTGQPNLFRVEVDMGTLPTTFQLAAQRLTNNSVQLQWTSAVDRGYRVHRITNGIGWTPYSNWMAATGSLTTLALPPATNNSPNLFRVEVAP